MLFATPACGTTFSSAHPRLRNRKEGGGGRGETGSGADGPLGRGARAGGLRLGRAAPGWGRPQRSWPVRQRVGAAFRAWLLASLPSALWVGLHLCLLAWFIFVSGELIPGGVNLPATTWLRSRPAPFFWQPGRGPHGAARRPSHPPAHTAAPASPPELRYTPLQTLLGRVFSPLLACTSTFRPSAAALGFP